MTDIKELADKIAGLTESQRIALDVLLHEVDEPKLNVDELHRLLEQGTTYTNHSTGETTRYEWEPRADWHGFRLEGWGQIADALGWECRSCRPDVGWAKWDTAIKDFDTNAITIHVECGHCGDTTYYDEDGNEKGDE